MKEIFIKNQKEFDALPIKFDKYTTIILKNTEEKIIIRLNRENSSVVALENSSVVALENSSVVARENSSVVALENSSVVARGNSSVEAWGNSSVEAWENSSVVAWGNSSVEAWGNSSVEAWENSSVVAWGNSSVVARENSSVEAWGNVAVWLYSDFATVSLFLFSVCWQLSKGKINKNSTTCGVIIPKYKSGTHGWLERECIKDDKKIVLFKKVSIDFKTQKNEKNETLWLIGSTVKHNNYEPEKKECGEGKFHACSRPYFCDEFSNGKGDRYIAIEIKREDMYAWEKPLYPHKIAFSKGKVLYECDKFGKKIN